jgi:hypothetical protein
MIKVKDVVVDRAWALRRKIKGEANVSRTEADIVSGKILVSYLEQQLEEARYLLRNALQAAPMWAEDLVEADNDYYCACAFERAFDAIRDDQQYVAVIGANGKATDIGILDKKTGCLDDSAWITSYKDPEDMRSWVMRLQEDGSYALADGSDTTKWVVISFEETDSV